MRNARVLSALALAAAAWVAGAACSGDTQSGDNCAAGTERCRCLPNQICNAGLTCASGFCVDTDATAGSTGQAGSTGAAGSTGTEGLGGTAGGDRVCPPGQIRPCSGPGECLGAQRCNADGTGYGECECSPVTGGTGGAPILCTPGTTQTCLGPAACQGVQVCNAQGTGYGPCDCGTGGIGGGGTGGIGGGGTGGIGGGGTGGFQMPPCESFVGLQSGQCNAQAQEAQTLEVNVLLVIDKSLSMQELPSGYEVSKWQALEQALSTALTETQGAISFGLELFPTTATGVPIPPDCYPRCCEMPAGIEMNVPIGPGAATVEEIIRNLQSSGPAGGTPTSAALTRAYDYFTMGAGAALGGDRYVLLATDGGPNCNENTTCGTETCTLNMEEEQGCPRQGFNCCTDYNVGCLDDAETINQIQRLASAGIRTIVVGLPDSEIYAAYLQDFAIAGGFEAPGGGYYAAPASGGVEALTDTFRAITTQLADNCEVPLDELPPNLNELNVAVECSIVGYDQVGTMGDRWYLDNPQTPTRIIIAGPICERIQSQGVGRIDLIFGCPIVTASPPAG